MKRITTIRRVVTSSVMTLVLLLHVAAAKAQVANPIPQAIWTAGNNTLTFVNLDPEYVEGDPFYRETVTAVWSGTDVTATGNNAPGWSSVASSITTVVFDESFSQYIRPTNCCKWFANCHSLQTITGIENLNTSEVTNMSEMFSECWSLTSLDVSSFDTSNVTNMEGMFFNCNSLTSLDVSSFNTSNVTDMGSMFQECSSLTSLDVTNFVTSNVTNMECMFQDCSSLTSLDLSNFNTSSVENMHGMFDTCSGLTSLDLSNFDTSNVTEMGNMFLDCSSLTTIVCNNTWTPTSSNNMFRGCTSLVGGLGTAYNVENPVVDATYACMDDAFIPGYFTATSPLAYDAQAIWTEGNSTLTFVHSHHNYLPGDTFNGQTVTKLYLTVDVTNSGTSPAWLSTVRSTLTKVVFDSSFESVRPRSLVAWFYGCSQLTEIEGISNLNTSEVTSMSDMFNNCRSLTSLDLSNFDTSNVTTMSSMFNNCSSLTSLDLSNFDTSKVTDMRYMFYGCTALTTIICNDTWTPTSSNNMFKGCTSLVGGLGTAFDEEHIDAEYARLDDAFIPGYFTATSPLAYEAQAIWTEGNTTLTFVRSHHFYGPGDTFNGQTVTKCYPHPMVTYSGTSSPAWLSTVRSALTKVVFHSSFASVRPRSLRSWFNGCSQLTEIEGISNLNTSEVTDMGGMFNICRALTSLDLSNFDTSNVTTMSGMFNNCSSLTSLDLSNFDTSNVTTKSSMFNGCSSLTTIICDSTWTPTSSTNMFANCESLVGGAGTTYNSSNINAAYAHPDGGTTNPGYFTSSTEVITANKPGDKETYWATYYYSGSYTVALPAAEQSVKIYTARYSEEEGEKTLVLTEVTDGVIMAGQGVIIESNQPSITMKHSLTRTATDDDFFAENELKGRDHACALPTDEGTIYTMGNVGGQLGFYKYTGSQLKARRAYLAIPAGSEAGIRIRFADEDTATGIDEVQSTIDKVQSASIYDLQGRRVVNPTKGIYIVNGKKVYMK